MCKKKLSRTKKIRRDREETASSPSYRRGMRDFLAGGPPEPNAPRMSRDGMLYMAGYNDARSQFKELDTCPGNALL